MPFMMAVQAGLVDGAKIVNKFGRNPAVGTTPAVITTTGTYETPTVAKSLEILSASADDAATGAGVQEVRVYGIDDDGNEQVKAVEMDGTTAVQVPGTWRRVWRVKGIRAGSYAALGALSQKGEITLRETGGGTIWTKLLMIASGFGASQSQIGAFTIPKGWFGLMMVKKFTIESTRVAKLFVFSRDRILDTVAPFSTAHLKEMEDGVVDHFEHGYGFIPIGKFDEMTDIGMFAEVSVGSGQISCDFQVVLFDKEKFKIGDLPL